MKRFLKKTILFILPFLLAAHGLDYLLSGILKKSNDFADGEYPVWNALYEGKINSDIVIYGSSRALVHINPVMISDSLHSTAYNLGINGHSFRSEYFRHSLIMKYNKKPKIIIQTLDITSFEKMSDLYNPDQFLPYMLNNEAMKLALFNGFSSTDYDLPMIRFYGKKEAFIEICELLINPSGNNPERIKGYRPNDLVWNNDLLTAQQEFSRSFEIKSDSSMICLFEEYLKECQQRNIKIVFVFTPQYIEGQKFVSNWPVIMSLYYDFSRKYEIPFLDYSVDSISFRKEYFYNSGHLNKAGSQIFTARLLKDLQKYQIGVRLE